MCIFLPIKLGDPDLFSLVDQGVWLYRYASLGLAPPEVSYTECCGMIGRCEEVVCGVYLQDGQYVGHMPILCLNVIFSFFFFLDAFWVSVDGNWKGREESSSGDFREIAKRN